MDERDLQPASIQSGANFNLCPGYSQREDRVALLKEIIDAMLVTQV